MSATSTHLRCINCECPEQEAPLIHLRYQGNELWICSSCLPTLIHSPKALVGKLVNAEKIKPAAQHK
jgi:hypothetical protein